MFLVSSGVQALGDERLLCALGHGMNGDQQFQRAST
jgi:hypothetical protein